MGDNVGIVHIVNKSGKTIAIDYMNEFIEQLAKEARAKGEDCAKSDLSVSECRALRESLVERAVAGFLTRLPPEISDTSVDRLHKEEYAKREDRDHERRRVEHFQERLVSVEQKLVEARGQQPRTPHPAGVIAAAAVLGLLFAIVLVPTIESLMFMDPNTGEPAPGSIMKSFAIGLGIGIAIIFPSFYSAYFPVDVFVVQHGSVLAGAIVALGVGSLRFAQVGLNAAAVGITVIELGIILFIELIAAIIRARFKDRRSVDQVELELRTVKEQLRMAQESFEKSDKALDVRVKACEAEEENLWQARYLTSNKQNYVSQVRETIASEFDAPMAKAGKRAFSAAGGQS